MIKGHDLCFDKTCQGNRLVVCAVAGCEKMVRIMTQPWCDVTLPKVVSRSDLWNIVLSTVVCEICLAESDMILVFEIYFGVYGDGTRLAMPKTICVSDSSLLKPGSGASEGVLD